MDPLIDYKNHTGSATPPPKQARGDLLLTPTSLSFIIGRSALLAGMQDVIAIWKKAVAMCPQCQELNLPPRWDFKAP